MSLYYTVKLNNEISKKKFIIIYDRRGFSMIVEDFGILMIS